MPTQRFENEFGAGTSNQIKSNCLFVSLVKNYYNDTQLYNTNMLYYGMVQSKYLCKHVDVGSGGFNDEESRIRCRTQVR